MRQANNSFEEGRRKSGERGKRGRYTMEYETGRRRKKELEGKADKGTYQGTSRRGTDRCTSIGI